MSGARAYIGVWRNTHRRWTPQWLNGPPVLGQLTLMKKMDWANLSKFRKKHDTCRVNLLGVIKKSEAARSHHEACFRMFSGLFFIPHDLGGQTRFVSWSFWHVVISLGLLLLGSFPTKHEVAGADQGPEERAVGWFGSELIASKGL